MYLDQNSAATLRATVTAHARAYGGKGYIRIEVGEREAVADNPRHASTINALNWAEGADLQNLVSWTDARKLAFGEKDEADRLALDCYCYAGAELICNVFALFDRNGLASVQADGPDGSPLFTRRDLLESEDENVRAEERALELAAELDPVDRTAEGPAMREDETHVTLYLTDGFPAATLERPRMYGDQCPGLPEAAGLFRLYLLDGRLAAVFSGAPTRCRVARELDAYLRAPCNLLSHWTPAELDVEAEDARRREHANREATKAIGAKFDVVRASSLNRAIRAGRVASVAEGRARVLREAAGTDAIEAKKQREADAIARDKETTREIESARVARELDGAAELADRFYPVTGKPRDLNAAATPDHLRNGYADDVAELTALCARASTPALESACRSLVRRLTTRELGTGEHASVTRRLRAVAATLAARQRIGLCNAPAGSAPDYAKAAESRRRELAESFALAPVRPSLESPIVAELA